MYPTSNQYSTALASHSCTAGYKSSLIKKTKIERLTGGKFGYKKNPGGHAKIKGIFGRKKLVRIFLKKEFVKCTFMMIIQKRLIIQPL